MSIRQSYLDLVLRVRAMFAWAPAPVASGMVLLLAALFGLVLHRVLLNTSLRVPGSGGAFLRGFLKGTRRPSRFTFMIVAVVTALPVAGFSDQVTTVIGQVLLVAFILTIGYACALSLNIVAETSLGRMSLDDEDNLLARKHTTQIRILKRATNILIFLVTIAAALMTIRTVREYGVSLFASAGAASLVVGLAARPLLTNLIAGVQIAITQPIRMEDALIVEGEWGWVEEITSTYVVVRLWDWRRMILPISYFLEKPFQNWTHSSTSLIGSVFLHLDYRAPVERLREKLAEFAHASALWDGQVVNLQVSDASEQTIQIRMLVSARNAPQAWDLRCEMREKMIGFIQSELPDILPRTRVELPAPR